MEKALPSSLPAFQLESTQVAGLWHQGLCTAEARLQGFVQVIEKGQATALIMSNPRSTNIVVKLFIHLFMYSFIYLYYIYTILYYYINISSHGETMQHPEACGFAQHLTCTKQQCCVEF